MTDGIWVCLFIFGDCFWGVEKGNPLVWIGGCGFGFEGSSLRSQKLVAWRNGMTNSPGGFL